ncbi:MAG: dihydrolipoamide acetyltransferase family protein [Bacteroidota bacterium]|jgi:2-oxoglutarate dehydrogenase E2 component (dihydrolipoamide succinyltransferase)|nr:dihydrolipoamide acetyltransferase family protein [Bacteroidota bacterium]
MGKRELKMPKMGESVAEATIISWQKKVGDKIEVDETVVEIATDKVDSEIPSEVNGTIKEILFDVDDVVKVGQTIAIIETNDGSNDTNEKIIDKSKMHVEQEVKKSVDSINNEIEKAKINSNNLEILNNNKFYSPLVKNIAKKEGISNEELNNIVGSGKNQRVTKNDILNYIDKKTIANNEDKTVSKSIYEENDIKQKTVPLKFEGENEIIEMSRMRKLIADHMTMSKSTSAHVTSFNEVDMTNIVNWRNSIKNKFKIREKQNITFTPIIIEAIIKALIEFPMINISVDGNKIIKHKNINIGMATALSDGNLIVPVIKNGNEKNLLGLTKSVNDLANRARNGKLNPDDTSGGTFTFTNVGSFGSVMGTPIINQPQVAILAAGVIQKKPAVLETEHGDLIGIRSKMFLSLSYDHRVVDGALGGSFLNRVAHYLESFDIKREI